MNSADFNDWKRHPITQGLFNEIERLLEYGKDELAATAGEDPALDSRKVGKIAAYRDILDITFEEVEKHD